MGWKDAPEVSASWMSAPEVDTQPSIGDRVKRGVGDVVAGAVRGAGSIGATLLTPYDLIAGNTRSIENPERRDAMDQALRDMGADTSSLAFKGGKLAAEIAGTAGAGGAVAQSARAVAPGLANAPKVANLLRAVETGGVQGGNLLYRTAGGAVSGAAQTAIVDPGSVGTGAAVGAALPGGLVVAGKAGRAVGSGVRSVFQGERSKGAAELATALDAASPAEIRAIIQKLRGAETMVPGASPTVAQALDMPQASIVERIVAAGAGGEKLRNQYIAQAQARLAALEGVAPTVPTGAAQAREDIGREIASFAKSADAAEKARVSRMYEAVDPFGEVRVNLPIDRMEAAADQFMGRGTFGSGSDARTALAEARKIGTLELPAIDAVKVGKQESLVDFVKKAGGIRQSSLSAKKFGGEVSDLRQSGLGRVVYKNSGQSLDRMTEKAYEAGFIPDEDPALLLDALRTNGRGTFAASANLEDAFQAAADRAAGGVAGAETVASPVRFQELQNLRSSISEAANKAGLAGNNREAAALRKMVVEIDAKTAAAADGALDAGEYFPRDIVDTWKEANAAHAERMGRFRTGPQARLFKEAADGQPALEGGQVASAFWGLRGSAAADVRDFRRLIGDDPALMDRFRSMVITEGAGTANASGDLGARFAKWVSQARPGLAEAFTPEKVRMLERIAEDIQRADRAASLGKGVGSDTYQKAQNALSAGLLDSPAAKRVANLLAVKGVGLESLRSAAAESLMKAKGQRLANALADVQGTTAGLDELLSADLARQAARERFNLLSIGASRSAPVLMADR